MPQQVATSVLNNFGKGLVTDASGLNFPENACTDIDNCVLNLNGTVSRRLGFDYETNYAQYTYDRSNAALSSHRWYNAGGDGNSQIYVQQIGATLYFYLSSSATTAVPLSGQKLVDTVDISSYLVSGSSATVSDTECQYADGNGYLFVFHPYCEPFFCKYAGGTITSSSITIKIRDVYGITEIGVDTNTRPGSLTTIHKYNLENQGWTSGSFWQGLTSTSLVVAQGLKTLTLTEMVQGAYTDIKSGDAIAIGSNDAASDYYGTLWGWGIVVSPPIGGVNNSMTINIATIRTSDVGLVGKAIAANYFYQTNSGFIDYWYNQVGSYPSNADVWFLFKDTQGKFNPAATLADVTFGTAPAAKGHFIFSAFNQDRSSVSGVSSISDVNTVLRPRVGAWFQGRVWYAGVDASVPATGTTDYFTWTETIYFSQIIEAERQFGLCHQAADPTSERLADLQPSDGGTITIQGCGSIYKLFPIQNGMLVFAANGIWFISGSTGLGFTASDYVVTKVSSVKTLSSNTFIDVQGYPVFWNADGIYSVTPTQSGFAVDKLTQNVIQIFYNSIPQDSKRYAKGSYDPVNHVAQWVYRSTQESSVQTRYEYDHVLSLNTLLKGFYKYSFGGSTTAQPFVHDVVYVDSPGGSTGAPATFKYLCSDYNNPTSWNFTFAEEKSTSYQDWQTENVIDYTSYITSGYRVRGEGLRRFGSPWINIFTGSSANTQYSFQTMWDYATTSDSGRWSNPQFVRQTDTKYSTNTRRLIVRGRGLACQFKIGSVTGAPFNIYGWSVLDAGDSLP